MGNRKVVGGAKPSTTTFLFKNELPRKQLRCLMDWWVAKYPQEVKRYKKDVRYLRENVARGSGVSHEGNMAIRAVIPTRIEIMMDKLIPGFWKENGSDLFLSEFQNLKIKPPK